MILRWCGLLYLLSNGATFKLQDDPPVTCPIPIITNGLVTNHDNEELSIGETLTVQCGNDYELSTTQKSVCTADGSYSPPVPTCNAKACKSPTIENGYLNPSSQTIEPEASVTVECNNGYVLSSINSKIRCVTNNIFDPFNRPTCNAQNCNKDTVVPNGKITGPTPYISPGSKLLIQCSQGYKEVDINITCVTRDKFDPEDGISRVCQAQNCVIPAFSNGVLRGGNNAELNPDDELPSNAEFTVECNDQYALNSDSDRVTCVTLNIFNPEILPKCMAQDCPEKKVEHGSCPAVKPNQLYQVTCDENYKLSTSQDFTCISGTIISPADQDFPTCEPKDCTLEAIDNGEITGDLPLKPGATATLKCGADYRLEGTAEIECVAGNQFLNVLPSCVGQPCPVKEIEKGSIPGYNVGGTIPAETTFSVVCDDPYALSSEGDITCVTLNTFNPNTFPTCIRTLCERPDIEHGEVTGPSTITPGSTLIIQCDTGYVMSHSDDVVCYSKAKFNPDPPTCDAQDCPRPDDSYVTNGRFTPGQPDTIRPEQTYTIECSVNYRLEGSDKLTCQSGTVFREKAYPKCVALPCPKSGFNVPNGRITNGGIEIPVNDEISKVGDNVFCVAGNQASGDLPTCTGYDCTRGELPNIANGDYSKERYTSGDLITVQCNNGYKLTVGTATCLTRQRTSGTLPRCEAQACTVDNFRNGNIDKNGEIPPTSIIQILCNKGYVISDDGEYRCVTDRLYNPQTLPTCDAVPCPTPDIPHSTITNSDPIAIGGALTVTCDENYEISDGSRITCVSGTVFSKDLPTCDPTPCTPIPTIVNGRVDTTSLSIPVNGEVRVICDDQYKPSHTDIPICITNGTYQPALPTCNDKDCGIPSVPNGVVTGSSSQTVSPDSTLTVGCNAGYDLDATLDAADGVTDGSGSIKCVRATEFDPVLPDPTCIPRPCPIPSASRNNATLVPDPDSVSEIQPGSSLTVRCHSRYQIRSGQSEETVMCVAANTYKPPAPVCQAKSCPPPTIANGDAGSSPITPLERLIVNCNDGYDLSVAQSVTIRCFADDLFTRDDGATFSTEVPTCNPRDCLKQRVAEPSNGRIENTEDNISPGTEIKIRCDNGFVKTPVIAVQCVTRNNNGDNVYSRKLPECAAQPCPIKDLIENGFTNPTVTEVQPGEEVIYTCNAGFSRNDTAPLLCVTSNQFSTPHLPVCRENCVKDDDLIPNGYISGPGVLKTGQQITISCNTGYVKKDPSEVVKCVTKSEYDPASPQGCKAVPCPLPSINRARFRNTVPVAVDDELLVECDQYYRLTTGATAITCKSGEVFQPDISTVKCVEKPCILTPNSIENGIVSRPDNMPGTQVQYEYTHNARLRFSCKEGYVPSSTQDSICDTDIIWRPPLPTCDAQNCIAPDLGAGVTIRPRILRPDTVLSVSCPDGKVPNYFPDTDIDPETFKCVTENQFSINPLPECEARPCQAPDIPNSNYDGTQVLQPGASLQVSCDGNYTLENPAGYTSVSCVSRDYWSSTDGLGNTLFPRCRARNCGKPVIPNGIVSTLDVIIPGSTLELNCGTGYVTPPINTFTCVSYEIYEPQTLPQCGTTDCVVPESFEHGSIKSPIRPGDTVVIKCDTGYKEDCEEEFTCITGTVYNPNSKLPQCKPLPCVPQSIKNGNITGPNPITPDSVLTIQCVAGKAITSHIMPKCVHTTVFEPPLSDMECIDARNCTDLPEIAHGSLSLTTVAPGQYATLACDTGYRPTPADGRVFCVVGGMKQPYYPPQFGCSRITCNLPEIGYGYIRDVVLYQGDQLDIQCKPSYFNPYTAAPIRCVQDDTFSVNQPFSCLPVEKCVIPEVSHGRVSQEILPIGTPLQLLCDPGYYDPYNGDVRCTTAGTISHSNIACQTCDKTYDNTDGEITSPMFGLNNADYPHNIVCTYTIRAQNDKHVRITLQSVDIEKSNGCAKDSLKFYDGEDISNKEPLYTACGTEGVVKRAVREIASTSSVMTIVFESDGEGSGAGFLLGYAAFAPGGTSSAVIAAAVVVPLLLLLILAILLFLYCRYCRPRAEVYEPHKNFHWKDGGAVDNAYFHFIANGGRKPPPSMASKLQVTAQLPEDETESCSSRSQLTDRLYYSDLKLGQTLTSSPSRPQSRHSKRTPLAPTQRQTPSHRSNLSPNSGRSHASSNFNSRELENLEKYNHKKALEGLGLSEADFKLNIPTSYAGRSNASTAESEDDSLTRTALEDTLMDGDPLQHTVLSDDVLRSPQTMRALEKFRAGARKERFDDPNDENYEMKKQNRILSEENLAHQRRAYNAGYRRPLPPSHTNL
ncbi:hypothetical protein ACHWQZ_G010681 [Mnemiopsis leidyi]